jgi:hypothetical protein
MVGMGQDIELAKESWMSGTVQFIIPRGVEAKVYPFSALLTFMSYSSVHLLVGCVDLFLVHFAWILRRQILCLHACADISIPQTIAYSLLALPKYLYSHHLFLCS